MALPLRATPSITAAAWQDQIRNRQASALNVIATSAAQSMYSSAQPSGRSHVIATSAAQSMYSSAQPSGRSRSIRPLSATPPASAGSASEVLTSPLEKVEVFDLTGKAVPIIDLWRERKAVVAFARHFGCVLCRKRADLLASKKELMDAAGVTLVLIGPGSVDQAKAFSEQTKFQGEIYADPSHSSYDALSFVYGVSTTFTPSAGMKIIQSYLEGYRQDWELSFKKDTMSKGGWQQGGLLVAGPGVRNISYIHKDKEAGDDPDIEEVMKACCL